MLIIEHKNECFVASINNFGKRCTLTCLWFGQIEIV